MRAMQQALVLIAAPRRHAHEDARGRAPDASMVATAVGALERTAARIRVTAGAETLVGTMRAAGAFTALVSGGFKFCTTLVRARLGFDVDDANDLQIANGKLTGALVEPVLDRDAKRA